MNFGRIKTNLRKQAKDSLRLAGTLIGKQALSEPESRIRLAQGILWQHEESPFLLPALDSVNGIRFFPQDELVEFRPDCVWDLQAPRGGFSSLRVTRSGAPWIDNSYLPDLDFGNTAGLLDQPFKRKGPHIGTLIAPWSHFWGGYYDYTLFVVAKLVRIRAALDPAVWEKAQIAYAYLGTKFESQWLDLLGIGEPQRLNTKTTGLMSTDRLILGNNQRWFYPSPADVLRLRDAFRPEATTGSRKLFLCRKGTRTLSNEAEIISLVSEMGFEIIPDEPMRIPDQIEMFSQASVIIGVHGAAFTNLLWVPDGARVLELFSGGYYPPYFYYLSRVLGLDYRCLIDENLRENHHSAKYDSMHISPETLRKALEAWPAEKA